MTDQVISVPSITVNITPFGFQFYAKDFFEAYTKHKSSQKYSPARLFLLTHSIELAAKSLHLAQGRCLADILRLGHDLEAVCDPDILAPFGISLTQAEEVELKKANDYYKGKGFEYFLFKFRGVPMERSGPQQALSAWPGLPDESILESLLVKLVAPNLLLL
jgi:hypothetical protein